VACVWLDAEAGEALEVRTLGRWTSRLPVPAMCCCGRDWSLRGSPGTKHVDLGCWERSRRVANPADHPGPAFGACSRRCTSSSPVRSRLHVVGRLPSLAAALRCAAVTCRLVAFALLGLSGLTATPRIANMEDILTAQFDRVEKALSTLVDSIAAYNPSPQAAIDLVAADEELSQGLDQCT
jgi:hypothetical protein